MGQVPIKIGERSYRLSCGEGEEARLGQLAEYINAKMRELGDEHGQIGEERLIVMAMLLITDELFDARDKAQSVHDAARADRSSESGDDAGEAA